MEEVVKIHRYRWRKGYPNDFVIVHSLWRKNDIVRTMSLLGKAEFSSQTLSGKKEILKIIDKNAEETILQQIKDHP